MVPLGRSVLGVLLLLLRTFGVMKTVCYISRPDCPEGLLPLLCQAVEAYEAGRPLPEGTEVALIYSGRNRLYRVDCSGLSYVLKRFARQGLIQRCLQRLGLRASKAERSHRHSLILEERGIGVARSIGYAEHLQADGHWHSYHISLDLSASVAHLQAHARGWAVPEGFVPALAEYLVAVHEAGIEHLDLSPGNILYRQEGRGGYHFAMVDLNRMRIHERPLSRREAITNMARLMNTRSATRALAYYYAQARGWAPERVQAELEEATDAFWSARHLKLSYRYARRRYGMGLVAFVGMYLRYRLALSLGRQTEAAALYRRYLQREDIRHIERRRRHFGYQYTD